ncbi:hypothetical protein PBAT_23190 [Paenibacillus antarcticus]|uniref:HTH lacI-type domain-containing protein n=1 Tax=Paenibacillus antarcticus TaxID=253703 RepID=A0A168J6K6_9BACL|nr:hypothetical protein PBAT_23190 [Paenibacillus antarcticus]
MTRVILLLKKTTMKDIATKANVSIATVSYVLNNVDNQTIPETTRSHILRLAEELHYIPNLTARSLVRKKTGLIGILINKSPNMPYWKRHNYSSFIGNLEQLLTSAGYHTLLFTLDAANPSLDIIVERKLEAVFLVDVRDDVFYSISSHFVEGIPLILMDSIIEDKLFKQIIFDYHTALQLASPHDPSQVCLIMENYNNASLVRYILEAVGLSEDAIYIINDISELEAISTNIRFTKAIVINEFIGNYLERLNIFSSITVICTCHCPEILTSANTRTITFKEDKSDTAFRVMEYLLQKVDYSTQNLNRHYIKVNSEN